MMKPGTILQERYLIEKQIGEGGMGAVYLATDLRFDNFVAIKETFYKDDEFGEAFEREAKILNSLLHFVLPHVSDYFTEGDEHYLVMQFIEGEDASDILKTEGAFPVKDVLRWTDNLLDALDYLHSQEPPIIHRDLKPSNLKITPRGDVFLLDFGLAKLKKDNTLSERSVFGYSRKYSPLEQIQGTGTDARSDIFALAATVYHLFTGSPPVDAIARASAIVAGKPDPIRLASEVNPEVSVAVANILNSALSLNAENRFVSANAMRQAFMHAVKITFEENTDAPQVVPLASEFEPQIIQPAENENFPALEAFAAEKADASHALTENADLPVVVAPLIADLGNVDAAPESNRLDSAFDLDSDKADSDTSDKEEIPPTEVQETTATTAEHYKTKPHEVPTVVAPRANNANRSPLPIAALVVLLAVAATVSSFFIFKNRNASEPTPATPEISSETKSEPAAPTAPTASEIAPESIEQAEIPDLLGGGGDDDDEEDQEIVKTKPPVSAKKTVERETIVEEPEAEDEIIRQIPHQKPARAEIKRSAPKPKVTNGERRERVVRNEQAPDIESIFTGRPSWERDERKRRREIRMPNREEWTEEEFREMRRQRRRERRRNAYPVPF